jgi:uncharacterized membrane protein YhaH (DUF805 family)
MALYFPLGGRVGRSTYWIKCFLPYLVIYLILLSVDSRMGTLDASVKRCRDRDHSGWFLLLGLIPILNLWPLIELGFLAGTDGPNRYGDPE